jgi:hypothetical protein
MCDLRIEPFCLPDIMGCLDASQIPGQFFNELA